MTYVKINDKQYPATIRGFTVDREWDNRDSKAITLEMSYEEALSTWVEGVPWSIVHTEGDETFEHDNSEYCIAGSVTNHRNGTVTVKMGKFTEVEILQKQLANAVTEEELEAAYTEGVNSL